jgi:DNA-binding transcriptional ArsR family regulator
LTLYNPRGTQTFVQQAESLDRTFAALADPTRRSILARLATGEATVNELAEPFAISQPAISRHIRVLSEAGLIVQRIDGSRRPCRLAPEALSELDQYLQLLRKALTRNYQRLDQLLAKQTKRRQGP